MNGQFPTAADLWFWWIGVHQLKDAGTRAHGPSERACTYADVLLMLDRLQRGGRLRREHVEVLVRFGRQGREPDADHPAEATDARLWQEAMREIERESMRRAVVMRPLD